MKLGFTSETGDACLAHVFLPFSQRIYAVFAVSSAFPLRNALHPAIL